MSSRPAADGVRFALDRRAFVRAFDRAARGYDTAASLQRHAAGELLERLQFFGPQPQRLLDLGAGTCDAAAQLARRYPRTQVLAVDLSPGMLRAARQHWWRRQRYVRVCADACVLPLADHSVDLIYSNLMLQWCDQPERAFTELSRVLRPNGLLLFSSLGPQALSELREAWSAADAAAHVTEFPDMPQLGAALAQAGFLEPVLDVEPLRRHYADVYALAHELRALGAHNAASARARGLTGRARWRAMTEAYERRRTPQGLPATFELLFGAAFNGGGMRAAGDPHEAQERGGHAPGEYAVPLEALRRRRP
jgi:malonyl-CoA O-methyltransferase